jgi:hypothetical protein
VATSPPVCALLVAAVPAPNPTKVLASVGRLQLYQDAHTRDVALQFCTAGTGFFVHKDVRWFKYVLGHHRCSIAGCHEYHTITHLLCVESHILVTRDGVFPPVRDMPAF